MIDSRWFSEMTNEKCQMTNAPPLFNVKGDAQLWFHVPFNPKLGETAGGQSQWLRLCAFWYCNIIEYI